MAASNSRLIVYNEYIVKTLDNHIYHPDTNTAGKPRLRQIRQSNQDFMTNTTVKSNKYMYINKNQYKFMDQIKWKTLTNLQKTSACISICRIHIYVCQ